MSPPRADAFLSPLSFARSFERETRPHTSQRAAVHQFPEQQQIYSISDASKRHALSFSLSVLGLPQ
jgi:hypothetical protein